MSNPELKEKGESIKVNFVQTIDEETQEYETEGIWCYKAIDGYVVDNIPFVAKRISLGDTIAIEYDEDDKQYYFDGFIATSGNTTVRLYFNDQELIKETQRELEAAGTIQAFEVSYELAYKTCRKVLSLRGTHVYTAKEVFRIAGLEGLVPDAEPCLIMLTKETSQFMNTMKK